MRKPRYGETDDPNVLAHRMVEASRGLSETPKSERSSLVSQVMAEMGRKGEKIDSKRRLQTMAREERSQVALNAAKATLGEEQRTIVLNRNRH
jgi:hypothetical protein